MAWGSFPVSLNLFLVWPRTQLEAHAPTCSRQCRYEPGEDHMTIYKLGNGKDVFNSATAQGWADGSEVFGQNGVDAIIAVGNDLTLDGGNGVDSITATGNNNDLIGGLGSDKLSATGIGNTLNGGNGADTLISVSAGTLLQIGAGNTM